MALNIPMPESPGSSLLQGLNTGSTMMSRMMQPIIERERMKQAQDQFQQDLALRNAEFKRSGANLDLQRQIMQQNLLGLQHSNDPMYEFNKFKQIQGLLTGGNNAPGVSPAPGQAPSNIPMGGGNALPPSAGAPSGGSNDNTELMKNNPMLRGFFKQTFGFDPLQQTPEEKQQAEVNKAVGIDQAKGNFKKATDIENTADTLMQYAFNNEKISNILDRNKNATGNIPALQNYLNLGGTDSGEFNNLSIPMQGQLAKELSNRGGAVVAKLAAGGKYNLAKNNEYNTGIRKSTTNDIINTYDTLNDRYKRLTGKELPQKLSPFYDKWRISNASPRAAPSNSNASGFDAKKMLDYKYSNADEFKQAMNSLNPANRQMVIDEMKNRGWH